MIKKKEKASKIGKKNLWLINLYVVSKDKGNNDIKK